MSERPPVRGGCEEHTSSPGKGGEWKHPLPSLVKHCTSSLRKGKNPSPPPPPPTLLAQPDRTFSAMIFMAWGPLGWSGGLAADAAVFWVDSCCRPRSSLYIIKYFPFRSMGQRLHMYIRNAVLSIKMETFRLKFTSEHSKVNFLWI